MLPILIMNVPLSLEEDIISLLNHLIHPYLIRPQVEKNKVNCLSDIR